MATRTTIMALACGLALAACTQVLGLEEAELDGTDQALMCVLPDQRPAERCTTTNQCETCLAASCKSGEIPACIDDPDCRKALFNHRVCVRDDCEDETGACGECLAQTPGAQCLADCGEECGGGEIISLCDLYCACMAANCDADVAACTADCNDRPIADSKLQCLISHCELADVSKTHCAHANPETSPCPEDLEEVAGCSAAQVLIGYGCGNNGDCCSGLCSPNSRSDSTGICQ